MSKPATLVLKFLWYLKTKLAYLAITVIIVLLGWVFILIGCNRVNDVITSSLLFSVGASLIAAGIVVFLDMWREVARDNLLSQVVRVFVDAGLRDVYRKRDLDKYDDQMKDAKHSVDIAGYTLNAWYESYADLVVRKVQENPSFRVRILMVAPKSSFSKHRAGQEGKSPESITDSFERIRGKFADCRNIEIRVVDTWLTTMVFRIDNVMYVGPHLYERPSKGTLTMELDKGGWLFEEYEREFAKLWERGISVSETESSSKA